MVPMKRVLTAVVAIFCMFNLHTHTSAASYSSPLTIASISVKGNSFLPDRTLLDKIPFQIGDTYFPDKTNKAVAELYKMGFQQVTITPVPNAAGTVDIIVTVVEKPALQEIIFEGNAHLTEKDIEKKFKFKEMKSATLHDINHLCIIIENLYKEKGYLFAKATGTLKQTPNNESMTGYITIDEGTKATIKKVRFKRDDGKALSFHGKKLRSILYTKEDWIFGMMDHSGYYHPHALEVDKYTLENFYQSSGFLHAKVLDASMRLYNKNRDIEVTFTIHEGDRYTVSSVNAPGNDIYTEKQLLLAIPLRPGMLYSKELIRVGIERLKTIWGDQGYIYADIDPVLQPDEEKKTVAITFTSELNNKIMLRHINIHGNKKTRDKIIRRRILMDEQEPLTSSGLEQSKQLINNLGYFDPKEGVNWKLNRITDDMADLDLLVKEIKTGRAEIKITYGGAPNTFGANNTGAAGEIIVMERNLFGKGMILHANTRLGSENQMFEGGFTQPWLFDKPIRLGADGLYNHSQYDTLKKVTSTVEETQTGASISTGFVSQRLWGTAFIFQAGYNGIDLYSYGPNGITKIKPTAVEMVDRSLQAEYQRILNQQLSSGHYLYIEAEGTQDTRNHTTHISEGYKWDLRTKIGIPAFKGGTYGYIKFTMDGHWYTPLIDEHTLVLHLHGYAGFMAPFSNYPIPYRELYHIGGPSNVRGWEFGQIGPMWYESTIIENEGWQGSSIGAKRAFFVNAELTFPIRDDLSMKGVLFYDGGSGWDTPDGNTINPAHLKNNSFNFRHCIGFGIRLLNPQPMRVDWGFKLDRQPGETASEVSLSSYYDF